MNIKVKFPLDSNDYIDARFSALALFLFFMTFGFIYLDIQFRNSRASLFPSAAQNMTYARARCIVPYDECRCSVLLNKSNNSIQCITDAEAMAGHILPLVSYVLQLYLIYELLSFRGKYSHIFTDIFRIVALLIFIVIAVGIHGSSCRHFHTSFCVVLMGTLMFGFVMILVIRSDNAYSSQERRNISRNQRVVINNHDRETMITITVHANHIS